MRRPLPAPSLEAGALVIRIIKRQLSDRSRGAALLLAIKPGFSLVELQA